MKLSADDPLMTLLASKLGIHHRAIINVVILTETEMGVLVTSTIGTGADLQRALREIADKSRDQIPWELT